MLTGKVSSLVEVKYSWSLKDLALFHHFQDLEDEGSDHYQKKHEREMAQATKGRK